MQFSSTVEIFKNIVHFESCGSTVCRVIVKTMLAEAHAMMHVNGIYSSRPHHITNIFNESRPR